ncbi:SDR family NAD(P)-dependent oxidoreductase [Leptothoe sp. LEGE 181152]|nr:SDR family NAD(P)-dependent oxidoreductase [Leptothoe sp. LEGE 181152]
MDMQGKTALVTGASRGIGRAIAIELAKQGSGYILLIARDLQKLREVAAELRKYGTQGIPLSVDLTEPTAVNIVVAQAWKDYGPFDLLVNCAGVAYQSNFLKTPLGQAHTELSTNLMGLYTVTWLVGRRMASRRQGTIVNVSSLMGKVAAPTMATYSATKFAIVGFTQALRHELAAHNVRVVTLLPSLTDTDMVQEFNLFRWVLPLSTEEVAQGLITGLKSRNSEIAIGWQSHMALWFHRFLPQAMDAIIRLSNPTQAAPTYPRPKRV